MTKYGDQDFSLHRLIPFKLDLIFKSNFNPQVPCDDCGKFAESRSVRFVWVNIADSIIFVGKELSLDDLAQNMVWTILCPECWRQQYGIEPEPERVQ
jgi:hypothetical protein